MPKDILPLKSDGGALQPPTAGAVIRKPQTRRHPEGATAVTQTARRQVRDVGPCVSPSGASFVGPPIRDPAAYSGRPGTIGSRAARPPFKAPSLEANPERRPSSALP